MAITTSILDVRYLPKPVMGTRLVQALKDSIK